MGPLEGPLEGKIMAIDTESKNILNTIIKIMKFILNFKNLFKDPMSHP